MAWGRSLSRCKCVDGAAPGADGVRMLFGLLLHQGLPGVALNVKVNELFGVERTPVEVSAKKLGDDIIDSLMLHLELEAGMADLLLP